MIMSKSHLDSKVVRLKEPALYDDEVEKLEINTMHLYNENERQDYNSKQLNEEVKKLDKENVRNLSHEDGRLNDSKNMFERAEVFLRGL